MHFLIINYSICKKYSLFPGHAVNVLKHFAYFNADIQIYVSKSYLPMNQQFYDQPFYDRGIWLRYSLNTIMLGGGFCDGLGNS